VIQRVLVLLTVAGLAGSSTSALGAPTPTAKCQAEKLAASGKFVDCRLKAEATFALGGDAAKRATAITKCAGKLSAIFAAADAKYGGSCPTGEPPGAFEAHLGQCSDSTVAASGGGVFGTGSGSSCGNGVIDTEGCDGGDVGGQSCESLGLGSGTLACDSACALDTSGCVAPTCGDGVVNAPGEQCDGADLGGQTCAVAGYTAGSLGCAPDCTLDVSACANTRCCQVAALAGTSAACTDIEEAIASEYCAIAADLIPGTALTTAGDVCSGATGTCGPPPAQTPGTCCQVNIYGQFPTCAENGSSTDCATINSYLTDPFLCSILGACGTATAHPGEVCRPGVGQGYFCQAP